MIAPTWNNKFELRDCSYSVSDIQGYIKYNIRNMKHQQQFILFIFTLIELIINCSKQTLNIS